MIVDTATNDTTSAINATTEEEDDEDAVLGLGALAEATRGDAQEEEHLLLSGEDDEEEDEEEDEVAKPLRGGAQEESKDQKLRRWMENRVKVEAVPSAALSCTHAETSVDSNSDEKMAAEEDDLAKPLRGGGLTKNAPVKMEESSEVTTEATMSLSPAVGAALAIQQPLPSSPTINSGASTPTRRELENLSVPTPLKLADEHELTYSNYGRVQRSRKKPAIFQPLVGAAREWRADGDNTPTKRQKISEKGSEDIQGEAFKTNGPEPLRGGARPKKEETPAAAATTAETAKSSLTPEKRGPGRPPSKHTKNTASNTVGEKKIAKRTLIKKKETNPNISGVGILNRKPGSLFDCSVCLDIGKIKLCCYCACRLCFNKFGKEQTILCDKCDQEYHTFCLGLDGIPDEEWECPACIEDDRKKKAAQQRKEEREAKKKAEEDKKIEEEERKAAATAKRRAAYQERKRAEEEKRRLASEKRKIAYEKKRQKEVEMRVQVKPKDKVALATNIITRKRGPGRPPKSETLARLQAQLLLQQQQQGASAAAGGGGGQQPPIKRGRGRPRKDGSAPIPRKLPTKSEISAANVYIDTADFTVERSRSGRKIQRTVFHDEVEGGGLMKRPRTDDYGIAASASASHTAHASRQASLYVAERSAAAAAKNAIALGGGKGLGGAGSKKEPRRKPGARECMQMSRKFNTGVIEQKYFDVLMDYSKRGKVDHLIRMRERMDEHSRFLESQLAGLEALVKEKGEWNGRVPAAQPKADDI